MKIPIEIDLYSWYDYAFLRAILKLPIPSPRVWDNAGRLGFKGGRYLKDVFFDSYLFEDSIFKEGELTRYVNEIYGNSLRLEGGLGQLIKADKSNHKFKILSDNSHLYLNFKNFKKAKSLSEKIDYQKIYDSIAEIYTLATFKESQIDSGFQAPVDLFGYYNPSSKNEEKWINLNKSLEKEFDSDISPIKLLYENVYKLFDIPSKQLYELNEKLNNDFWFIDMFLFSFKPTCMQWLKGKFYKSKDYEEPKSNKIFNEDKSNLDNPNNQNESISDDKKIIDPNNLIKNKEKKDKPIFSKAKQNNSNSNFPSWLPLLTIPLIFLISRSINNSRSIPPQRVTPTQQGGSNVLEETCKMCRMTGDCSAFPFCTKSQTTCKWKQNWAGEWVKECKSF